MLRLNRIIKETRKSLEANMQLSVYKEDFPVSPFTKYSVNPMFERTPVDIVLMQFKVDAKLTVL